MSRRARIRELEERMTQLQHANTELRAQLQTFTDADWPEPLRHRIAAQTLRRLGGEHQ